jgi:hypothetical protein
MRILSGRERALVAQNALNDRYGFARIIQDARGNMPNGMKSKSLYTGSNTFFISNSFPRVSGNTSEQVMRETPF